MVFFYLALFCLFLKDGKAPLFSASAQVESITSSPQQLPSLPSFVSRVHLEPEKDHVISVDRIYSFDFSLHTNQYLEVVRFLSNETRSLQQTDLFSLDVDYPLSALLELIQFEYCPKIKNTLPSLCLQAMEKLVYSFQEHAAREGYTPTQFLHKTNIVDSGFFRRVDIPTSFEEIRPILPENHFYYSKKGKHDMTKNLAGDIAVVVSGYWPIAVTKYSPSNNNDTNHAINEELLLQTSKEKYFRWFQHSLKITMPYIFFAPSSLLPELVAIREHLPTLFVSFEAFEGFQRNIRNYPDDWIHTNHVPSASVAKVWLQKMNLVYLALQLYRDRDYYIWIDAGITSYRDNDPPPYEFSKEILLSLPKDRISYSMVKGEYHSFAATVMIFPKTVVLLAHYLFYQAYEHCETEHHDWRCGSEQFLWTTVREKYPELFHSMSYDYGEINFLWGSNR